MNKLKLIKIKINTINFKQINYIKLTTIKLIISTKDETKLTSISCILIPSNLLSSHENQLFGFANCLITK